VSEPLNDVLRLLADNAITRTTARALIEALRAPGLPREDPAADAIAVIGVAAELPGATNYEQFWEVLIDGRDMVTALPAPRRSLCEPLIAPDEDPEYLSGAWLQDIHLFDAPFFKVTPSDARAMDPQHRRFFQIAYNCWEDAGWAGRIRGTKTGVYVSIAGGDYAKGVGAPTPSTVPGRVGSFAASRMSYLYDLRGPAYVISSTCASSLVALHDACLGLRAGDCEMALVGGATIFSYPYRNDDELVNASGIMSGGGRCRPFDESGDGIGRGEGVVALLLKPHAKALADGDRVRAVIRSTAVNNDGASASLTAPNPRAHTELLRSAWERAGVSPEDIDYLEAHGTGTQLGDPIELRGIHDAVRATTEARQFLAVGSVKGNIGHLMDGVAGLSGFVKAMLVLEHGVVPPTVNLSDPNSHFDFLDSPLYVPTWPTDLHRSRTRPLRAGVSCFGFNGTNAHAVLEAAAPREATLPSVSGHPLVLPLSALTDEALQRLVLAHAQPRSDEPAVQDAAWTLCVGRDHLPRRVAILAYTFADFQRTCRQLSSTPVSRWHEVTEALSSTEVVGVLGLHKSGSVAARYVAERPFAWLVQFGGQAGRVVSLPGYPFSPDTYWSGIGEAPAAKAVTGRSTLKTCLAIVGDVLGCPGLSRDDNFIVLGGSSLAALQVQTLFLREYGWDVGMAEILGAEDLGALAEVVESQQRLVEDLALTAARTVGSDA